MHRGRNAYAVSAKPSAAEPLAQRRAGEWPGAGDDDPCGSSVNRDLHETAPGTGVTRRILRAVGPAWPAEPPCASADACTCRELHPRCSGAFSVPRLRSRPALDVAVVFIGVGECAMMPRHAAASDIPGHHERVRAHAAPAAQRLGQGRGDPRLTSSARGAATSARRAAGPVSTSRPGLAGRIAAPSLRASPAGSAATGTARTRSRAGTASSWHAATRRGRGPAGEAGRVPCDRSVR